MNCINNFKKKQNIINNNNNNNNNNIDNNNKINNNNGKHIINISKLIRCSYKYCFFIVQSIKKTAFNSVFICVDILYCF